MQTSAQSQEPDLFAGTDHQAQPLVEFTGVLAREPEVRVRAAGHGLAVPVLCIELEQVGRIGGHIHAEQALTPATREAAAAAAKALRVGQRITVRTPLAGQCLVLPNAVSITAAADDAAATPKP